MKKILIIADFPPSKTNLSIDSRNFVNAAIGSQQLPSGVKRLAENSWLIDAHTSLSFFASLVNTAQSSKIPLVVFSTEDEPILISPGQ